MIYQILQLAMIIKLASYVANSNSILTIGSVVVTSLFFFSLQCYVLETCAETLTAQLAMQHSPDYVIFKNHNYACTYPA